jgi:PAS domain S-box-containing protein
VERLARELETLLSAGVDALVVIDHHGRIEALNRAAEQLFGYSAAEVLGQHVVVLMPEPTRAERDGGTGERRIIGRGREVQARRRDGSLIAVLLSMSEIPGSSPPRFVGVIQDISERRAAVDALRLERDRAQSYLDLAEVMMVALDTAGRISLINRKGCEILGYPEQALVGNSWFDVCVPEAQRALSRQRYTDVLAATSATLPYHEETIRTRDGTAKLIAWRGNLLRNRAGEVTGILTCGEDVTEQRRAAEALRGSEALLRAAQQLANLGNFELQLAAGTAYWSEQVYRITGFTRGREPANVAEYIRDYVHPDDRERVERDWARVAPEGAKINLEHRLLRPDGAVRDVHLLAQGARGARGASVVSGTLHDVTERRAAEREVRQSHDKLTHFARLSTMGEMATGLAHEINQPLTAIATYSQAASRMLRGGTADPAELSDALAQITSQALRAGEVIRGLRNFVKDRVAHTESVDVNGLIEDVRVLAATDARASDVRLILDLGEGLPLVAADPVQIQQVLLNLVRNAIDVTLETVGAVREVTVQSRAAPEEIEVCVMDHGAGIASAVATQLFHPFFTTKASGTGLGLAISRSIIRAHHGKLGYRPTGGGGSTFYFSLPAAPGG